MATVGIVLTGSEKLNVKLAALETKIAKKYTVAAARYAMKVLLGKVKSAAPVDSGDLRASLKVRALRRSRSRVGVRITTQQFGGKQFYGAFVEFGTRKDRQTKAGADTGGIEGEHFMKDTTKRHQHRIIQIYQAHLKRAIETGSRSG